jgi:hypothetical protein
MRAGILKITFADCFRREVMIAFYDNCVVAFGQSRIVPGGFHKLTSIYTDVSPTDYQVFCIIKNIELPANFGKILATAFLPLTT